MRAISILVLFISFLQAKMILPDTFEADFSQVIQNEQNQSVTYKGNIKAIKEQKALWIYNQPILKKIYFVKNEFVIIEEELEQAIYGKNEQNIDIFEIFQKAKKIDEDSYTAECCSKEYMIMTKNGKIDKIRYLDKLDNQIEIQFSNVMYDLPIDDKVFKPNIPKDYDLIRR